MVSQRRKLLDYLEGPHADSYRADDRASGPAQVIAVRDESDSAEHRGAGHRGGFQVRQARPGLFPLTVDYIEKTYAAGKIPGSFFKREAKPSEHETLTSRLIDRPIRPLFPEGFFNEVQVVVHPFR